MTTGDAAGLPVIPPGAEQPRRYRPKLRYELIGCGLHGHELLGTDAADLRPDDDLFAREFGGLRWYRCLRCDSWIALTPPAEPATGSRRSAPKSSCRCAGARCGTNTCCGSSPWTGSFTS